MLQLTQYMRMNPCILPKCTISSCAAFHNSSWVLPNSNCSLDNQMKATWHVSVISRACTARNNMSCTGTALAGLLKLLQRCRSSRSHARKCKIVHGPHCTAGDSCCDVDQLILGISSPTYFVYRYSLLSFLCTSNVSFAHCAAQLSLS